MKINDSLPEKSKKILEYAKKEFAEKGFHNASVDNIAENAGVGKGTVYRHFGSKESLFLEVSRDTFIDFMETFESTIEHNTFKDTLKFLLDSVLEHHLDKRDTIQIIFHYVSKMIGNKQWKDKFFKFSESEIEILTKIVQKGIERGEITEKLDVNILVEILRDFAGAIPKKILLFNYTKEKLVKCNEVFIEILTKGLRRSS